MRYRAHKQNKPADEAIKTVVDSTDGLPFVVQEAADDDVSDLTVIFLVFP